MALSVQTRPYDGTSKLSKTGHKSGATTHLALVLLVSQSELNVRVTQAVGIHRDQVPTFDEGDADDPSPQLGLPVQL